MYQQGWTLIYIFFLLQIIGGRKKHRHMPWWKWFDLLWTTQVTHIVKYFLKCLRLFISKFPRTWGIFLRTLKTKAQKATDTHKPIILLQEVHSILIHLELIHNASIIHFVWFFPPIFFLYFKNDMRINKNRLWCMDCPQQLNCKPAFVNELSRKQTWRWDPMQHYVLCGKRKGLWL